MSCTCRAQEGDWFAQPLRIVSGGNGHATGVEFARTQADDPTSRNGPLRTVPGSTFTVSADMVVKALGQEPLLDLLKTLPGLRVAGGKVVVDRSTGATSVAKLFAGGDCIRGGGEIVDAVQDGKVAARGIHQMLTGGI